MTDGAIVVEGLTKHYRGRAVVDRLGFCVSSGEVMALLGPNGAGKTTTVEIIEGYRRPDGGSVRVLGTEPSVGGSALKARVGLMLQGGGGVYPQARPREVLRLFRGFHREGRDPDQLLDLLGLRAVADARYRRLSGGEKQRLALAVALVGDPEVLILDEPTAGMDPAARMTTRDVIADLRARGTAILLTTHDLADVERLADRVVLIDHGRTVIEGSPAELTAGGLSRLRFRLATDLEESDRLRLAGLLRAGSPGDLVHEGAGRYRLEGVTPSPELIARLAGWCSERGVWLVEMRAGGGTLEERYLELIHAEEQAQSGAPA